MKKILSAFLVTALLAAVFTGCEETDKDIEKYSNVSFASDNDKNTGNDNAEDNSKDGSKLQGNIDLLNNSSWTDMRFMFNGELYTLDLSCDELAESGMTFDPALYGLEGSTIDPGVYIANTIHLSSPEYNGAFTIGITARGDSPVDIENCTVYSAGVDATEQDTIPDVYLPGGVTFDTTLDQVIDIYGNPTRQERFENEGYTRYSYIAGAAEEHRLHLDFFDNGGFLRFVFENF